MATTDPYQISFFDSGSLTIRLSLGERPILAPELEILDVKPLGDDLHRIHVRARDRKAIPTISAAALKHDLVKKGILPIEGSGLQVVSGGIVDDIHLDKVKHVENRPHMIFTSVPSFGKRDVQWIVRGRGEATITFRSVKTRGRSVKIDL